MSILASVLSSVASSVAGSLLSSGKKSRGGGGGGVVMQSPPSMGLMEPRKKGDSKPAETADVQEWMEWAQSIRGINKDEL